MVVLVGLVLLLTIVVAVRLRAGRSPEPPSSLDRWWLLPPVVGLVLCAPFLLWGGAALASYAFGSDDDRGLALLVAGYVGLPSLLVAGLLATAVVLFRRRAWVSRVLCAAAGMFLLGLLTWARGEGLAGVTVLLVGGGLVASAVLRSPPEHHGVPV